MLKFVHDTLQDEPTLMRETFIQQLIASAKQDDRIMALDSDCAGSSGYTAFGAEFPERFINCGIAEANMTGIAAGLSLTGKLPFTHAFGVFATRRTCDQIALSCAYTNANVRIVGTDPGVCASLNGGTHMPFEDMAVLRGIPGVTLIEPTDSVMLRGIFGELTSMHGVVYIRLKRKITPAIYKDGATFKIGKANLVREGSDVTLIASGIMIAEAVIAAQELAQVGIAARVVDMFTWKPLDADMVAKCARETGAIVTCENHNIIGGLGDAISAAVCATTPCPVERVGVNDTFGEVGSEGYLKEKFGLTAAGIVATAERVMDRK